MSDLDLLAGIVGSDGHLVKDEPQIIILNKDKEFVDAVVIPLIKNIAKKNPSVRFVPSGFGTGKYFIRFWSPELWNIFQEKYCIPKGKKSDIIVEPNIAETENKIDFIRGWISGDGSVTTERKRPVIEIWSKRDNILKWFQSVFRDCGIESKIFYDRKKDEFILIVGKRIAVEYFYDRVIIPHPAKQRKLKFLLAR